MSWWLILTLAVTVGWIALRIAVLAFFDYDAEFPAFMIAVCGVAATIALSVSGIVHAVNVNREPRLCHNWGEKTGTETRWIQNSYWDWDCYVQVDGRWIPRGQVRLTLDGETAR
jgi:hypothetical protein